MKKSLLLCLSLLLVVIMVGCNNSKGGEDALTVFDVNSTTKYDMKIDFNIGNVVEISTALFLVSIFVWNKGISNYESAGS